jgi:hypothetical protein
MATADPPATQPAGDPPFEDVLVAALDVLERDGAAGIERLLAAHPHHAARLRDHLARLQGLGLLAGTPRAAVPDPAFPERLGEFRLLRRLGGGGMGVVYLAEQPSLGRTVALKLVRSEHLFFPAARERFRREVEAIAKLQHPGIVPVHAAGEDAGVPWLAMEHIVGASLDSVLQRLLGRDPATLRGDDLRAAVTAEIGGGHAPAAGTKTVAFHGSWLHVCLQLVRNVALALQHAHDRGVLHRDVKPSNIMLTPEGRAQLLDFGLAVTDGGPRLTGTGSQLGTPAYMAPEQMRGDHHAIDARTDVYALGVTLFELLTLQAPFAAASTAAIRDLVLAGRLPPLRERNRAISRDAELVCRKAVDLDPSRRYASAAAFADDLGNVIERRPIQATPPSAWLITRRWAQRHPARAVGAVAGVLLFLVAPTVFLLQQQAANTEVRSALATAQQEERRATANAKLLEKQRDLAMDVIRNLLSRVADEELLDVPRLQRFRRDLLASAHDYHQRFLADSPDDVVLREQTALSALDMVFAEGQLGRIEAAAQHLERAESLARDLLASQPAATMPRLLLTNVLMTKGRLEHTRGRDELALTSLEEGRRLGLAVLAIEPDNPEAVSHLLGIERGAAMVLGTMARTDEELDAMQALNELWRRSGHVTVDSPLRWVALDHVIGSLDAEAKLHAGAGRLGAAEDACARMAALLQGIDSTQLPVTARIAAARTAATRSALAARDGAKDEQEASLRECMRIADEVLDNNPDHFSALRTRSMACNNLGLLLMHDPARQAEAMPLLTDSLRMLRQLLAVDPSQIDTRASLAATLANIGSQHLDEGKPELARPLFEEGEASIRECLAQQPPRREWQQVLYNCTWFVGQATAALGDHAATAAAAARLAELRPTDGKTLRIAAALCAQALAGLERDATLDAASRQARRAELERLGIEQLQQAADHGCTDLAYVRDHADLAPLRLLPGFAAALRGIEANVQATGR